MNTNIKLLITVLLFLTTKASFGKDLFYPYLQIGGTRFFNTKHSSTDASYDFFMPIWQVPDKLVFTDVRIYDRSGKSFEGNFHLGYRQLSADNQQLFGIYGAFDRKKTDFNNYFNQLTFGIEYRFNKLFIGGNFYQPIGEKERQAGDDTKYIYKNMLVTNKLYEKPLAGVDGGLGYELIKGLTGYVGGYYFKARGTKTVFGPKASLSYDLSSDGGKRVLGIFDKVGFEAGIQHDKQRGNVGYVGLNFRIGASSNKQEKLEGMARHMVDLIRRDVDIVTGLSVRESTTIIQPANRVYDDKDSFIKDSKNNLPINDNSFSDIGSEVEKACDFFELPKEMTRKELDQAYRKLVLKNHPDKNGGNQDDFIRIHQHYDVLKEYLRSKNAIESPLNKAAQLTLADSQSKTYPLAVYNQVIKSSSAIQDSGISDIPDNYYAANPGAMVVYKEPVKVDESLNMPALDSHQTTDNLVANLVPQKTEDNKNTALITYNPGIELQSVNQDNGISSVPNNYYAANPGAMVVYKEPIKGACCNLQFFAVIARSASDVAIQKVVINQNIPGLLRHFVPRNDGMKIRFATDPYSAANPGAMVAYRKPIKFEESVNASVLNLFRLKGGEDNRWVANKIEDESKSTALTVYNQDGGWLPSIKSNNNVVSISEDYYTNNSSAMAVNREGIDGAIVDSYSHVNLFVSESKKLNNETIADDEIAQNRSVIDFGSPAGNAQNYTLNMQDPRKKPDILAEIITNHPYVAGAVISTALVGGVIIVGLHSLPVVIATGVIAVNKIKPNLKSIKRSVGGIGSSIASGIANFFHSNFNHDHFNGGNAGGCVHDASVDVGALSIMKAVSSVKPDKLMDLPVASRQVPKVEILPPISPTHFVEETIQQAKRAKLVLQPNSAVVEQNMLSEASQATIIHRVAPAVRRADLVLPVDYNAELVELLEVVPQPFAIEDLPLILPTTFIEETLPQARRGLLSALALVEQNALPEVYQARIIRNIAPAANRAELVLPGVSRELALPLPNVSIPDLPEQRVQTVINSHVLGQPSPASTSSSASATPVKKCQSPIHDYSKTPSRYMSPSARHSPSESATERVGRMREELREGERKVAAALEQKKQAAIEREKADKEKMEKKEKRNKKVEEKKNKQ